MSKVIALFIALILLVACQQKSRPPISSVFSKAEETDSMALSDVYDLPEIQEAGELIVITLSGPESYYEYRGQGFGREYLLAESLCQHLGVRLRMEVAHDTTEMLRRLADGEVDLVAYPLKGIGLGANDKCFHINGVEWVVGAEAQYLREAIGEWYSPQLNQHIMAMDAGRDQQHRMVRQKARPMMLNSAGGQISKYDDLFRRHSASLGWDWRLLAAQCYQESAFDPEAMSWAGACGLMQLMPSTASQMGVPSGSIYDPEQNISAAIRYLKVLNSKFTDIADSNERIKFILASYNGGAGHVRDAMALCDKYGGSSLLWDDVSKYILALQQPRYYRDPVVKCGYLRGTETEGYVRNIMDRWQTYRGVARSFSSSSTPAPARRHIENGEHKSQVVRPDIDPSLL